MNPYKKYKDRSVESMSQGELLVLLYNEAIKDLKRMQLALENEQYDMFEKQADYVRRIVLYLTNTLDLNQDVSFELRRLYAYIMLDLGRITAGRKRRAEEIPALIEIMENLRDGFEGASKQTSVAHVVTEREVVV